MSARITGTQAILALGIFVAFLGLLAEGALVAGIGVLLAAIAGAALAVLVQRRRFPARSEQMAESVSCSYPCEVVWKLIEPAEMAPLVNPKLRRGYQVPGTPEGLGEQQALEYHDGTTIIIEVIEYEVNRRAVTRQVSPPLTAMIRSIETIEPVDEGCVYTLAVEYDLQRGQRLLRRAEQSWRADAREQVDRIPMILDSAESGSTRPGQSPKSAPTSFPPPKPQTLD
jgi:hypothetical protein